METKMLRWTAGETLFGRVRNDSTRQRIGVTPIFEMMREARLRWYGHVLRAKEVEAILKPIYEKFEEYCKNMDVNGSLKYYHSQAVVVEKGKQAFYGKEQTLSSTWNFQKSNEVYQSTDDYLILHCDFEINSKRASHKGKLTHIWKKEDGHWKLFHEKCESS
ncbi:unnamed protein product [Heligmosomoides polygyrus]|uniref:DUF4440 domain-containing protein n=1 Tax=Heligmosomoides polygyrus TaxID=6339 RepID=A0A183FHZ4_HELPZ|nr:unnamed protein product [Heligmosomoides polygyrus]